LAFLPSSIVITFVAGPLSAPLIKRIGLRTLGIFGGACMFAGATMLIFMQPHASYWTTLLPATVLIGWGGMFTYQVGFIGGLAQVEGADQGVGSGMLNTSLQIGVSVGVAIAAALSTAYGLTWAFGVSAVFGALTLLTCAIGVRSVAVDPKRHIVPMGKAALPQHHTL
jgi:predicted MFS family arabinose efflux permease